MNIRLRKLRPGDFETLWKIDQQCFPPGVSYSRQELGAYMRRWSAFTIVAEQDGAEEAKPPMVPALVGFIVAEISTKKIGHIITIDVLPDVQHEGIGSRLLAEVEARLREANCNTVVLEAAVNNKAALAFYDRHKYLVFKTIPHYYPNGVNAFVLRKDLLSEAWAS